MDRLMSWAKGTSRMTAALVALAIVCASAAAHAQAGPPALRQAAIGDVVGIGPYLHLVDDLDHSLAFYQALLGTEPTGSAEARAWTLNEPVAVMYGAPGAEIRTASLPIPGSEMYVELVAWRGVSRPVVRPRVYDPGATTLLLFVRNMDVALAVVTSRGGAVLTPNGAPVVVRERNRFIIVQDPDGFFIELLQTEPLPASPAEGNVLLARFRTTATDAERTARFYRGGLGFALPPAGDMRDDTTLGGMTGLGVARSRLVVGTVPGTAVTFEIAEFQRVARTPVRADIHGVGASMLRLRVMDIDAAFARVRLAGGRSVTPRPVTLKDNRRMVIVEDPDGLYLQLWQPAPQVPIAR